MKSDKRKYNLIYWTSKATSAWTHKPLNIKLHEDEIIKDMNILVEKHN